ncbi:hypothetical protein HELRODRAFT_172169 [Helobdella robusta]|uniref:Uncharacterized protein n=1 Tax=Helobdella robusta TaxID=6412 RepID=T1F539_HELRO|nr:hypothetical protein HELRODRAFT_172169 [Helobdella robusta]ESO04522.1 hypothetical protein HELRODRAFT_172169 [Helobdella robusta]
MTMKPSRGTVWHKLHKNIITIIVISMTILIASGLQISSKTTEQAIYKRAYSYLLVNLQKTVACFDEVATKFFNKFKTASATECVIKCRIAASNNLRGVNFIKSAKSCSCVPTIPDTWYNVTFDSTRDCMSFVTHDCPKNFDYVMENHVCFNLQRSRNVFLKSREACNNLSSSHQVVIESSNKNLAIRLYAVSREISQLRIFLY